MTRVRPTPFLQRGLTLVELMIAMLLGLIVISGVLGIFVANSETHRRTSDLSRIQENARVAVQLMGQSMREAGGNPCGLPPGVSGLFHYMPNNMTDNWWSGGTDFSTSFIGFRGTDNSFTANGSVTKVATSDALIIVSGNAFVKTVINDTPPGGAIIVPDNRGIATGDILFACNPDVGRSAIFAAGTIAPSGTNWSVARAAPFSGAVAGMTAASLSRLNAEAWFVGENGRGGTSLYRAFIGSNQPEEVAQDVTDMQITYLMAGENQYDFANTISSANRWTDVIAAHIELTVARRVDASTNIERTVALTVNLRNRF